MKKSEKHSIYATVVSEEGVNYREIADMMTEIGFKMNHSSARNYVLRVMKKFAEAITKQWNIDASSLNLEEIARSPQFQQAICEILQSIEGASAASRDKGKIK